MMMNNVIKLCLITLLALAFSGCEDKEDSFPEAKTLKADLPSLRAIPFYNAGPLPVRVIEELALKHMDGREIKIRAIKPEGKTEPAALIVFSHGNFSDSDKYDNLLLHWASHGYVVIAPTHSDGVNMMRGIFNTLRYGQLGLIKNRIDDIHLILDSLPALQQEIGVEVNRDQIAVAGHSFGAFTAQQMIGAEAFDENTTVTGIDNRVKAVLAVSPPGPMFESITENSWDKLDKPMMVSTGTWDIEPRFFPEWQLHKMSYDKSAQEDSYAVVFEGVDHYFGNLICRPLRKKEPQRDALQLLGAYSSLFFAAYVTDDKQSLAYLKSNKIPDVAGDFIHWHSR